MRCLIFLLALFLNPSIHAASLSFLEGGDLVNGEPLSYLLRSSHVVSLEPRDASYNTVVLTSAVGDRDEININSRWMSADVVAGWDYDARIGRGETFQFFPTHKVVKGKLLMANFWEGGDIVRLATNSQSFANMGVCFSDRFSLSNNSAPFLKTVTFHKTPGTRYACLRGVLDFREDHPFFSGHSDERLAEAFTAPAAGLWRDGLVVYGVSAVDLTFDPAGLKVLRSNNKSQIKISN